MTFQTHSEFIHTVNQMDLQACLAKLEEYKVTPFDNPAESEYFAKYLVQAERKQGVDKPTANVVYARTHTTKLFQSLPHLAKKYAAEQATVSQPAAVVKPAKVKAPVKVAKVVHPDGTVFFREDRQMWVVVVDGRQPAARDTKEKVLAYMAKKYPDLKVNVIE